MTMNNESRYISRNVIVDGKNIGLAIVVIHADGSVETEPFERETGFTRWTDSAIIIEHNTAPTTVKFRNTDKL